MTVDELQSLSRAFAPVVADAIRAATQPLLARIVELEKRPTAEVVKAQVDAAVKAAVEALPPPKDGRDGERGPAGEKGEAGERGEKGEQGERGAPGASVTDDQVAHAVRALLEPAEGGPNLVAVEVQRWLEAFPPAAGPQGERGEPGEAGPRGERGEQGERGEAGPAGERGEKGERGEAGPAGDRGERGERGADGVGLAGMLIDRDGQLVATMSDGSVKALGPVVGRDGQDGADGKDGERGERGFGLDDFDVEQPDLRTFVLSFRRGDVTERYELSVPGFIDRGIYKDGEQYELGDALTFGGDLWICQAPTKDRPGGGNPAWRLAARKGRDGKDGLKGEKGDKGDPGAPGRDGTSWGA